MEIEINGHHVAHVDCKDMERLDIQVLAETNGDFPVPSWKGPVPTPSQANEIKVQTRTVCDEIIDTDPINYFNLFKKYEK